MGIITTLNARRSVRSYAARNVGDDELATVLEAARLSQSAKNIQNWRFVVVRDTAMRHRLMIAARGQSFVAGAPVIIVCCGTETGYVMTCGQPAYVIDVAIAMENMAVAAHESGLGTCWLGAFYEDQVKECLGIPADGVRVVGMLTLGYPGDTGPSEKNRKRRDEIVTMERWDFQ